MGQPAGTRLANSSWQLVGKGAVGNAGREMELELHRGQRTVQELHADAAARGNEPHDVLARPSGRQRLQRELVPDVQVHTALVRLMLVGRAGIIVDTA